MFCDGHMWFWTNKMACGELLPINVVCLDESVVNKCNKPQSWRRRRACCTQRRAAKKPSGVTSSLQYHIKVAVGGGDFSSVQRHLTPLDVYLAQLMLKGASIYLFSLSLGLDLSFVFYVSHTLCHFLPLSQRPDYLFFSVFSGFCTLSFSGVSAILAGFLTSFLFFNVLSQYKSAHLDGLTNYSSLSGSLIAEKDARREIQVKKTVHFIYVLVPLWSY